VDKSEIITERFWIFSNQKLQVKNGSKRWIKERIKERVNKKVKGKKTISNKYNFKYNFRPSKKDKEIIQNAFSYGVPEDILEWLNIPINIIVICWFSFNFLIAYFTCSFVILYEIDFLLCLYIL